MITGIPHTPWWRYPPQPPAGPVYLRSQGSISLNGWRAFPDAGFWRLVEQCFDAKFVAGSTMEPLPHRSARPADRHRIVFASWMPLKSDWRPANSPVMALWARATTSMSKTHGGSASCHSSMRHSFLATPSEPGSAISCLRATRNGSRTTFRV